MLSKNKLFQDVFSRAGTSIERRYPAIPKPDGSNNMEVLSALKQVVEELTRVRGLVSKSSVSVQDLDNLGLINFTEENGRVERTFEPLDLPPVAQLNVVGGAVALGIGDVVAPYTEEWGRGITYDRLAGTFLLERTGVYDFTFDISGTSNGSNAEQQFNVRVDGDIRVSLDSVQKQKQEGVQATMVAQLRLFAGEVVDVTMTGTDDMVVENMVMSLSYFSSLVDIITP